MTQKIRLRVVQTNRLKLRIGQGLAGPQGGAGNAATIAVGAVTTLDAGNPATVTNVGTSSAAIFDFGIPEGDQGDQGDAATIAVGTVTTVAAGEDATVTNVGTSGAAIFDFEIPQGDQGDPGNDGVVQSIVAGDNIAVDDTDPANPIVSSTGGALASQAESEAGFNNTNFMSPLRAAQAAAAYNIPTRAVAVTKSIPAVILAIRTSGYATAGDGGGALYKRAVSEPSHFGKFQDAAGTWWELAETVINPRMFGADGTLSNNTAAFTAIVAALNAGAFKFLNVDGIYTIDATYTITRDGVTIFGDGVRNSRIHQATARSTFIFQAPDPNTTILADITVTGIGIDYGNVNNPLAGCALTFNRVARGYFTHLDIRNTYQGIDIIGGHELFFDSTTVSGAFTWSSVANGSFLFRTRKGAQDHRPSEIFVNNFNMKGVTFAGPANYLQSALVVQCADGLFMSNGHCGFASTASLLINPQNDAQASIQNLEFANVYFDGSFGGDVNGGNIMVAGSTTPLVKGINFNGCVAALHDSHGLILGLTTLQDLRWVGGQITGNGGAGVAMSGGSDIQIKDAYIQGNNVSNNNNDAVLVHNCSRVSVCDNHILAGASTHPVGINISASGTNTLVVGNTISGHTTGFIDAGTGTIAGLNKGAEAKIGYQSGVGAGGTVTQATSKITGVTINTLCGQIIMNAAALAAGAVATFVVTNTKVAAGDVVILNHVAGGVSAGSYNLNARASAGSFAVDVKNTSVGSLSEALVIGFAVIKAATN
jgi:hypothetical protein